MYAISAVRLSYGGKSSSANAIWLSGAKQRRRLLHNAHPVHWASHPPATFKSKGWLTILLFWAEVPAQVALEAVRSGWAGLEGDA